MRPKRTCHGYYVYDENGMTWIDDKSGKGPTRPDESWTQDDIDSMRKQFDDIWNSRDESGERSNDE